MLTIGIDPGDRGAIVALDPDARPVHAWTADDRGGELGYFLDGDPNARELVARLGPLRDLGVRLAVLETPFAPGRIGTANAITIGRRWGILYAALVLARLPVQLVTPAKWSADLFGGRKGTDAKARKAVAVRLVSERVPDLRLVPPGCRVPHDGLADAACLALWGMR